MDVLLLCEREVRGVAVCHAVGSASPSTVRLRHKANIRGQSQNVDGQTTWYKVHVEGGGGWRMQISRRRAGAVLEEKRC